MVVSGLLQSMNLHVLDDRNSNKTFVKWPSQKSEAATLKFIRDLLENLLEIY